MSDGGGPTDGGLPTDGGVVVVDASPVDAGGPTDGGGAGTIDCGMMTCNAATEQCCLGGGPGGGTATCIAIGDTCMGVASDCDGPEDCGAGQVCCASRDSSGGFGARCADSCGGGGTIGGGFELCHDAMDCSDRADMCCPLAFGGISGAYCGPMCFGTTP